jgi:hypothetical protein
MFLGPMPGSVSWASLASGPDGQVQRAVRAGVYLVTDGDTRAVILLLGGRPGERNRLDPDACRGRPAPGVTIIELSGDSLGLISTACSVAPDFAAGHDRHRGRGPDRRGRPGRVDQAVALELPDADARRALFGLYRGGLVVDESRLQTVLERTEGVTASFLKELLRRAALLAAEETDDERLAVSAGQLDAALDELLDTRNAMTRTLLGA